MPGKFIHFDVKNASRWFAAFQQAPQIATRVAGAKFRDILTMLAGVASRYPSPPAGSTYRRTGTLGRLWTSDPPSIKVSSNVIQGRIGNNTPYGPWVQATATQARVHRGRWKTIEQLIEAHRQQIDQMLDDGESEIVREIVKRAQ